MLVVWMHTRVQFDKLELVPLMLLVRVLQAQIPASTSNEAPVTD